MALVAIVWGHTMPATEFADRFVQSWRLPVFFMLTGYFWSARRTLQAEAEKRFRTLLVPYAAWLVIITVVGLWKNTGFELTAMVRMVGGAILGGDYAKRPFTTFWFFTALLIAVVLYRWLLRFPAWVRLAVVLVGVVANIVAGEQLALIPLAAGTAMGALVFLEVGRGVRRVQAMLPPWARAVAAAAGVAVAALAILPVDDFVPLDMKGGEFSAVAVIVALSLGAALLLAATAWTRMPPRLASTVTMLVKPSLAVIILHPLVLLFLAPETTSVPLSVVVALAFLLPLLLGHILLRTAWAPVLVGVDQVGQQHAKSQANDRGSGRLDEVRRWLLRPLDGAERQTVR